MTAQGAHPGERQLLDPVVVRGQWLVEESGVNETQRVWFDDGSRAYFKPFDGGVDFVASGFGQEGSMQPVFEAAAWQLAKRMGPEYEALVPPCVLRNVDGTFGSLAQHANGEVDQPVSSVPVEKQHAAAFFDMIVGNQDRNSSNYLVDGQNLHLIDHGFAFSRPGVGERAAKSHFMVARNMGEHYKLTAKERALCADLAKSEDAWGLEPMIGAERAAAMRERARQGAQGILLMPKFVGRD